MCVNLLNKQLQKESLKMRMYIQLLQLMLLEILCDKTARWYGWFIKKFTKLRYGSPLLKTDYINKFLQYFHPSYGINSHEIWITKDLQLPILPFGLVV